tara:strand:- start:814 stop:1077 length:264 start_codon:yes stop_codon:yes gene_type:complete
MTFTFKHPKYYKELRKLRNKSDQAISDSVDPASGVDSVRPGPGLKPQASSSKLQAASDKPTEPQASSGKLQASSNKLQAPSHKRQAP